MGKYFGHKHSDAQVEEYHPGCMWGILQVLDYHHWHNGKKVLPRRRHGGRRPARRTDSAKSSSKEHDTMELEEFLGGGCDSTVEQRNHKSSPINKRSVKARIKALVAKEICREEHHKPRTFAFPIGSQLQRTYSIHRLEPSNDCLDEIHRDWKHPIILLHKIAGASAKRIKDFPLPNVPRNLVAHNNKFDASGAVNFDHQKIKDADNWDVSNQLVECLDVLEIYKVNKELFEISRSPNAGEDHYCSLMGSKTKPKLTRSGSFPMADSSCSRNFRPSKLEDKQNEARSFPKGENLFSSMQAPKLDASKSSKDLYTKSMPSVVDSSKGNGLKLETSSSSLGSSKELNNQESSQVAQEGTLDRDDKDKAKSFDVIDSSNYDPGKGRFHCIRRSSSLNNSVDRYTQLFERSFNRDGKLNLSKSLKLTKDDEFPSGRRELISFRRFHSLSNPESCSFLQNEDASYSGHIKTGSVKIESDFHDPEPQVLLNTENCGPADAVAEAKCQENMIEENDSSARTECRSDLTRDIDFKETTNVAEPREFKVELSMDESSSLLEVDTCFTENASCEFALQISNSISETCCKEDMSWPSEFHIAEGSEVKPSCIQFDNLRSTDALSGSFTKVKSDSVENANMDFVNYFLQNKLDGKNHDYFFKEADLCGEEIGDSCDQQLLFDLVNGALLEIYEKSYTYWPRALSQTQSCCISPTPMGEHVYEAVWKIISKDMSLRSEQDLSLDSVMAQDFTREDGWMNLQLDTECVGLDLEDIIFDELLDEVICF